MKLRKTIRQARRVVKVLQGKDLFVKPDVRLASQRLGSVYGGWHVATQFLNPESIVYSFGIGEDISFDLALIDQIGLSVYGFDPTPKSIDWLKTQALPREYTYHEIGLSDQDGQLDFFPPQNPDHVSFSTEKPVNATPHRLEVRKISTIAHQLRHSYIDLIKADIEGSEFAFVDDLLKGSLRPGQLLIEFHHRFPEIGPAATRDCLASLRSAGYSVFHVAPSGEEISLIFHSLLR